MNCSWLISELFLNGSNLVHDLCIVLLWLRSLNIRVAKNISLRGNLDSLADISPEIVWFMGQLGLYKSILVTRNHFLSQEINSCHKKSILVSSHPSVKLINSLELTHFLGTWFPGSQWICGPGLGCLLISELKWKEIHNKMEKMETRNWFIFEKYLFQIRKKSRWGSLMKLLRY